MEKIFGKRNARNYTNLNEVKIIKLPTSSSLSVGEGLG
jgi:hypothetical protein